MTINWRTFAELCLIWVVSMTFCYAVHWLTGYWTIAWVGCLLIGIILGYWRSKRAKRKRQT